MLAPQRAVLADKRQVDLRQRAVELAHVALEQVVHHEAGLIAEAHDVSELRDAAAGLHHRGFDDQQVYFTDAASQALQRLDLRALRIELQENGILERFGQQRIEPSHRDTARLAVELLTLSLGKQAGTRYVVVNVEGHLAVLGAGGNQEVFGVEPLLELLQHRPALGDRFDQEIARAWKGLIYRGRTEGHADIDHRTKVETERLEVLEE